MQHLIADETSLFDHVGQRKYLTTKEARRSLAAAAQCDRHSRLFCQLLYYTGCRITEALQITPRRLDVGTGRVVLRTLKRRKLIYRAVPVPRHFLRDLAKLANGLAPDERLFPWCRQTGWRRVKAVMEVAGIEGPQATPKGFRHQFGCHGIECGLPESLLARLLGHADTKSTRIYTLAIGAEERSLTARMWRGYR